jgi:thioredoxin-like negative regulator of GroEL
MIELTSESFGSGRPKDTSKVFVVMYYAPWCHWCNVAKPELEKLSTSFSQDPGVVVGGVNCDKHPDVASAAGVEAFPTIVAYPVGKPPITFEGERNVDKLTAFVNSMNTAPVKQERPNAMNKKNGSQKEGLVLTDRDFDIKTRMINVRDAGKNPLFVMYYAPWCVWCNEASSEWNRLAEIAMSMGVTLAILDCSRYGIISEAFGVDGYPTFVLYKTKMADDAVQYNGQRNAADMGAFLKKELAKWKSGGTKNAKKNENRSQRDSNRNSKDITLVMFGQEDSNASHRLVSSGLLKKLAYKFQNTVKIGMLDVDANRALCDKLFVRKVPAFILFVGTRAYKYEGSQDYESICIFITNHLVTNQNISGFVIDV